MLSPVVTDIKRKYHLSDSAVQTIFAILSSSLKKRGVKITDHKNQDEKEE